MSPLPDLTPGSPPVGRIVARSQVGIVALDRPPRQGQDHEKEHFRSATGDATKAQAGRNQAEGTSERDKRPGVTTLKQLPQSGNESGQPCGAGVEWSRHHETRKAFDHLIEGLFLSSALT